jgi:Protein of unknown function (DUF3176)
MLLVAAEGLSQLKWRWYDRASPLKDLLTYDDASRGPWGALTLLWNLRGRQLVSSCGAFITVAALITDPFAQQVIATYDCRVPSESVVGTIPRTNYYDEQGPHTGAGRSAVSLGLQKSINAGIFNPGEHVVFGCPTGNCTFPSDYHTTGVCSECRDTTNELQVEKTNDSDIRTIKLPTSNRPVIINFNPARGTDYLLLLSTSGRTDVIVYPQYSKNTSIEAAQCSLFPCVRTYNAVVNGGRLTERLASVATEWNTAANLQPPYTPAMVDVECLDEQDQLSLSDAGYNYKGRSWIPYNGSLNESSAKYSPDQGFDANTTKGAVSNKCIYQYNIIAMNSMNEFLSTFLNGSVTKGGYAWDIRGAAQLQAIYSTGNVNFDHINETWKNLSDSITTYMRQKGSDDFSAPAIGQALRDQTCVHIQWLFLTYPAILVFVAIVFFICMVFETQRGEAGSHDWKSSPLALLFHGLDREALNKGESTRTVRAKEMVRIAERTPVRLKQTEDGWQFVRVQEASLRKR